MRQFRFLSLLLAINLFALPFLRAESGDPSELFLSAYMAVQSGDKLDGSGKFKLALQKYRYAASLLQQIHDKWPDWQPLIVDYRTKKTTESISKIQQEISLEGPGSLKEDVEPALPVKTDENTPSVSVSPATSAPASTPAMSSAPQENSSEPSDNDVFENGTIKEMRARYERMQRELADTKAKYADVQREKEEIAGKLDDAVKQVDKLRVNETQLKSQLSQAEEAYKNSVADKTRDADGVKQMKDEVARLQNAVKDAEAERDSAQDVNDDIMQKLKGVKKERDDAVDALAKAKDAQAQVDKLMADNASLMQKLNDAEKTIADFNSTAPAKDAEIAGLKKDVSDARTQLATALKQSQDNLNSMNDLQSQLETATTELSEIKSGAVSADDRKKLVDENELLKGIVIRERKEEAHRDQEKKLALAELGKMHLQSSDLENKINYLGQPVVKLTDQERALFKQPQIAISDENISISAQQQPDASPTPAAQAIPAPAADTTPAPMPESTPAVAAATPATSPAAAPAVSAAPTPATAAQPEASASPAATLSLSGSPFDQPATTPAPMPDSTGPLSPSLSSTSPGPDAAANSSEPLVQTKLTPPVSKELIPQANEAKEKFDKGDYIQAEKIYTAMLAQEPKNIYILSNLGVVRFRSGKLKPAEETFRKAITIAPDDAFSHRTLGIVYFTQGKLDEAVGELTKALAINTKDPIAHNYLGITCGSKGWQEAARKELETAVALDPNYADAHFNLAVIYLTTPPVDKDGAKKHYKRALELGAEPDNNLEAMINK